MPHFPPPPLTPSSPPSMLMSCHRRLPQCHFPHPFRTCPRPRSRRAAPIVDYAHVMPDEDSVRIGHRTVVRTSPAPTALAASHPRLHNRPPGTSSRARCEHFTTQSYLDDADRQREPSTAACRRSASRCILVA
jgi:hypothetical protein